MSSSRETARSSEAEPTSIDALQARAKALEQELSERTRELEAARRDAAVEVALEKVRERALAMRSAEELKDVAAELRRQMANLGQSELEAVAIHLYEVDENNFETWGAMRQPGESGELISKVQRFPKSGVAIIEEMLASYHGDESEYVLVNEGEKAAGFFRMLKEWAPDLFQALSAVAGDREPSEMRAFWSCADFTGGSLVMVTYLPADPDSLRLLKRCASAFDLAYRRYKDLRKAEANAREAKIEAAMERLRSRALAMHSSNELMDVMTELRRQIDSLGQLDLEASVVHLYADGAPKFESIAAVRPPGEEGEIVLAHVFFPVDATPRVEYMIDMYRSSTTEYMIEFDKEAAEAWQRAMIEHAPMIADRREDFVEATKSSDRSEFWNFADFEGGSVLLVTHSPASGDTKEVLRKAAQVIGLAYRRHLDLQEAESSAREAKIEAALERVRSRTMGMQSSDELGELSILLDKEVRGLGTQTWGCAFNIYGPEDSTEWFGNELGVQNPYQTPRESFFLEFYERGQAGETLYVKEFADEECARHYEYLKSLPVLGTMLSDIEAAGHSLPASQIDHVAYFKYGYLLFITLEPAPAAHDIFRRFARVFEQAYTRFLDLKETEAAARELQIEAALERVRARATAMRTSKELLEVMMHIHQEFSALGFPCGAFWNSRYLPTHYEKAVTGMNGTQVTAVMELPRDFSMIPELAAWERGTEKLGVFKFGAEASVEYLNHMINKGHFLEIVPDALTEELLREMNGWTFIQARTTHGELGYNLWGETDPSEDAVETLIRFAAVFDLAFRRFVDLQTAEAQAREAQIELALERVRAAATAMHSSEDLVGVTEVLFNQMRRLDFTGLRRVALCLFDPESDRMSLSFSSTGDEPGFGEVTAPMSGDGLVNKAVTLPWLEGDPRFRADFQGPSLGGFIRELAAGGFRYPPGEGIPERLCLAQGRFPQGFVTAVTTEPLPDPEFDVLDRFAMVFGGAYRRYEDLVAAERRAREAEVEAAMERVRGRAMAMQTPDDIGAVAVLMFEELSKLDIRPLRSGVSIPQEDETYEFWAATEGSDGSFTRVIGHESVNVHRILRRAYDGFLAEESHQTTTLEGEDLLEYYHSVFDTMPLPDWQDRMRKGAESRELFATFPFSDGWLYTFMRAEITSEEIEVFVRFARVFDLAYKRYHDLTKAEADYQALLEEKARTETALTDLRATQKQLIEQEKLASLGSLTAGIAHEIKNPLNFVNNFAEVSEELAAELAEALEAGDTEEVRSLLADLQENATQIAKHGKRADSIVKAMMQHARGGESTRETIDLNAFVEEYAALSWHGMRARDHGFQAELVRDLGEDVGSIEGLPQELGRVLVNLFGNAFDAVRGQEAGNVIVSTSRNSGHVEIRVSDNGPGIPPEIREKIFEPFFTTKPTGEGTGLGLSLSYDIVTKGHGGTMTVGSSKDGGAEFILSIPA